MSHDLSGVEAAVQQPLDQARLLHDGQVPAAPDRAARETSRARSTLLRVLRQRSAIIGLLILGFLVAIALGADVIQTHNPLTTVGINEGLRPRTPPCIHFLGCPQDQPQHLFGLDGSGRDFFSRVVQGSRISLFVGFITVAWSIVVGMLIGAVAGYAGGWIDNILMRLMDVLLAFPALLLAIVIVSVLGKGLPNAMLAIGVVSVPIYARVMRSAVLSVREQDYVTAARALGDSPVNILRRRIIPNALTPIIVTGTLGVGSAVLEIAALSFVGLAAQQPQPEWGSMIGLERNQLFNSPFLVFIPGFALTLTVLGFNLLGDGLRDAFDPRLSR